MNVEWISQLPKLDLHCHLDGSVTSDTIEVLLQDPGVFSGGQVAEKEQLREKLQVSPDCTSLTEYLEKFDLPLSCLQTEEGLNLAAYTTLEKAAQENIKYIEMRFAPMSSVGKGLNCEKVIEAVLFGIKKAERDLDIKAGVIVCAMRHYSLESNIHMLKCARNYLGEGVCALDLAGDESAFPTREQRELFVAARKLEMPFTIHSGECGSIENVREAIGLGAKRLGHGIALKKSRELMSLVKEKNIGIEMCPTSNFQTMAVTSWKEYPLNLFLDQGLLATINTDNRTVSNTTITKELIKISENLKIDEEKILKLTRNSIEIAFADDNIKHNILKQVKM